MPGPIRSITHVALAVVARVARQRRSTTRCPRSLIAVPGPALSQVPAHGSTHRMLTDHRPHSPDHAQSGVACLAVTRVSLTDGDRCPQCGQRSTDPPPALPCCHRLPSGHLRPHAVPDDRLQLPRLHCLQHMQRHVEPPARSAEPADSTVSPTAGFGRL